MVETRAQEWRGAALGEHPAVQAWARVRAGRARVTGVEILQKRRRSTVYRLDGAGPGGAPLIAKRALLPKAVVERTIYEEVLPALPVSSLTYYGFAEDDGEFGWIFLACAGGEPYCGLDKSHRRVAGRWLGRLHASAARAGVAARLPDRGPGFYRARLASAGATIRQYQDNPVLTRGDRALLSRLVQQGEISAAHWPEVERLGGMLPPTFIHGDFAPKNLRVERRQGKPVLLPFDFGSAGWGFAPADLPHAEPGAGRQECGVDLASYWASPDLAAYRSEVREKWPDLEGEDLRTAARFGKICRCLVCIDLDAQALATEWVERPLRNLRLYEVEMAAAMRAAGWEA
jgi:hypothetical protein